MPEACSAGPLGLKLNDRDLKPASCISLLGITIFIFNAVQLNLYLPDVASLYDHEKCFHPLDLFHDLFPLVFSKDELY